MNSPEKERGVPPTDEEQDATHRNLEALSRLMQKSREDALRVKNEPAFILNTWPWKETSLVADCFTRGYGRIAVTVRGAKRPASRFRGLINPFCPIVVSLSGAGEVKNLTAARWMGGMTPLTGEGLLSGFYLNELVEKLTAREVPHPELFDRYVQTLSTLAGEEGISAQRALREFEVDILRLGGWGQRPDESLEAAGPGAFCAVLDGLLIPADPAQEYPALYPMRVARAILSRDFSDSSDLRHARGALRDIIRYYVGRGELATRKTLAGWHEFLS